MKFCKVKFLHVNYQVFLNLYLYIYCIGKHKSIFFFNGKRSEDAKFFYQGHCYPSELLKQSSLSFSTWLSGTVFFYHQCNGVTFSAGGIGAVQTEITIPTGLVFFFVFQV